ncbi:hypothetical protein H312_02885 [Anncaliia algerae PRA339]|uniref:Uncharacterized protein n=1 Tax=Anncaliia algerae PRA339 TaxID=1288291 RepID=A0A059EY95_9MICR|nr:hypothetical protein H312_02885 [Anncaliia algerae PRA339]
MTLKKDIDRFITQHYVRIQCTPDIIGYFTLKALTTYLRSKCIRYEYSIQLLPIEDTSVIFINYTSLKDEYFNIKDDKCSTCILKEFSKFMNCRFLFISLYEYISLIKSKLSNLCDECVSLYEELFLLERKEMYPIYLFHNVSSLYLSLYHDLSFIKNNLRRNMCDSIKYYLAKEGISLSDSLQKFNQNAPLKETVVNKISPLENYFLILNELIKITNKEKKVLGERNINREKFKKEDFLLEDNKRNVILSDSNSINEGAKLYYELIETVIDLLNHKSLKRGYVLVKRDTVNDNIIIFTHLYELFKYFKNDVLFLCENGYVIKNKHYKIKGELLSNRVIYVEEREIKRIISNLY